MPHAVEVIDPFHVVQLAAARVTKVRCRLQRDATGRRGVKGDRLYDCRRALLTSDEYLGARGRARLMALFAIQANRDLMLAHDAYQRVIHAYRCDDRRRGERMMRELIDDLTGEGICVLDLDTVMPGSSLYDYGDSIRFGAATAAEDEKDLSKMGINLHLFQVYTAGYLAACKSLTPKELELLPLGAKIITLELAVRFVTDYLDGDRYFRVAYPEHNLVRARAQMKLVADMEAHWDEMQAIVAEEAAKRN